MKKLHLNFKRQYLPVPSEYYKSEGLNIQGQGEWRTALCPFHEDSTPSLRVHINAGAFRCMACGNRGGDVLAFHMKKYNLSFIEAAKKLGAWKCVL